MRLVQIYVLSLRKVHNEEINASFLTKPVRPAAFHRELHKGQLLRNLFLRTIRNTWILTVHVFGDPSWSMATARMCVMA